MKALIPNVNYEVTLKSKGNNVKKNMVCFTHNKYHNQVKFTLTTPDFHISKKIKLYKVLRVRQ